MLLVISLTTEMPRYYEIKHDSHECGWWGRGKNWFNSPINTMGLNGGVHKDTVPWIPCICMGITWTLITESVLWYTMRGYEHYEHYNLQSQSSFHSIYLYAPKMNFVILRENEHCNLQGHSPLNIIYLCFLIELCWTEREEL